MRLYQLTGPVVDSGLTFLGKPSILTLSPAPPDRRGWSWQISDHSYLPLHANFAEVVHTPFYRYMAVTNGEARFNIIEHLAVLRWLGVINLAFSCTGAWPPYWGRALETALTVKAAMREIDREAEWYTTTRGLSPIYHNKVNNGFLSIQPKKSPGLELNVSIDYPGLGEYEKKVVIDGSQGSNLELWRILSATSFGRPQWLKPWLTKLPHLKDRILWEDDCKDKEELNERIVNHRILDLLGALALTDSQGGKFLAATVTSHGAGHAEDLVLANFVLHHNQPLHQVAIVPRHEQESKSWAHRDQRT